MLNESLEMHGQNWGMTTSNTQTNPMENCKEITIRSDIIIETRVSENPEKEKVIFEKQEGEVKESEKEVEEQKNK